MNRAIFLDKDGTLVTNEPGNRDLASFRPAPGVPEALVRLSRSGYRLFVVSNQPGFALGQFHEMDFRRFKAAMSRFFLEQGCLLSGVYFCPHDPAGRVERYALACDCRKPQPGLLLRAAAQHQLDLSASWMVGDILNDVEAGHRAGCRSAFVDVGNETEWVWSPRRRPDVTASRFDDAIDSILSAAPSEADHAVLV